jgi:uncharacterized protein
MQFNCRHIIAWASVVLASLSGAGSAQQHLPTTVADQLVPAQAAARPALWKVTDADTTIYLFGTIHALPRGVEWFDGPIAAAFEGSGELVTEILEASPADMQNVVLSKAILPRGKSLRSLMNRRDRLAFEAAMRANGMAVGAFDRFEPWYAAIGLATAPLLKDGFGSENGVETVLDARARALGRPHSALETAEYQLGLFDALPLIVQKRYLREVVNGIGDIRPELEAIVAEWRKGNAARLAELMNADADDPAMVAALLTNRNRNWARWIKGRMARPGIVFVAVGAGHLAGKDSVQDRLQALGISTSRVQ